MWTPTKPGLGEPCCSMVVVQALREVAQALAPPARHHIEPLRLLLLAPRPPGRAAQRLALLVWWCSAGSQERLTHPRLAHGTHTPTHVQFAPAAGHQALCKAPEPLGIQLLFAIFFQLSLPEKDKPDLISCLNEKHVPFHNFIRKHCESYFLIRYTFFCKTVEFKTVFTTNSLV